MPVKWHGVNCPRNSPRATPPDKRRGPLQQALHTLRRRAIDAHKIKIVANRFIKKGWDIEPAEVERTLGLKIAHFIPNDFKTAITAINLGEPFAVRAPKSELSRSHVELAELLSGKEAKAQAA